MRIYSKIIFNKNRFSLRIKSNQKKNLKMSYIESVLQRLLIPDSSIIKQATKQLLEYFVSEKCIQGLFEVLNTSTNSQVN